MVLSQAHGSHIPFALKSNNAIGVYVWKSYLHKKRNWRRRLAAPHIPSAPRDAYVGELFEEKKVASDRDLRPQTPHSLKNFKVLSLYLLIGSGLFCCIPKTTRWARGSKEALPIKKMEMKKQSRAFCREGSLREGAGTRSVTEGARETKEALL